MNIQKTYEIKSEPIPTKPRWSQRLKNYYKSDEFQRKRQKFHKSSAKIKIQGDGKKYNSYKYKNISSLDSISEEAKPIKINESRDHPIKDEAYEKAKATWQNPAKLEDWRWKSGRPRKNTAPTTTDKILPDPVTVTLPKNKEERLNRIIELLNKYVTIGINKLPSKLGVSKRQVYRDIESYVDNGVWKLENGLLSKANLTPVDYNLFGSHNMGFTFVNRIPYEVYVDCIEKLESKPIIKDFSPDRRIKEHGNPKAECKSYLSIASSDKPFQYAELSLLWKGIHESFNTNRFKLTDFELNIDIPDPGATIKMWGVDYSRRELEGFIRAYGKNITTFRIVDFPINVSDIGGFRKPEELLPLLDTLLGRFNVWKENQILKAENNKLSAKNRKMCKKLEIYEKKSRFWWN